MHKIGDKILYGAAGVMTILDIREESVGDISRSYYVLGSATRRSDSLTYVPADNEALVSAMRPLLTESEIVEAIRASLVDGSIDWIPENRARSEYFKKIMESGDRARMLAMIRAIDESGLKRIAEGKKNFLSDENAKQKAERLLFSEFSIVLGIPEEGIPEFIEKNKKGAVTFGKTEKV